MTTTPHTQNDVAKRPRPRPASDNSLAFLSRLMTEREVPLDLAQAWIASEREGVKLSQGAVSRAIDQLRDAPRRAGFDWQHRDRLPSIIDEMAAFRAQHAQQTDEAEQLKAASDKALRDSVQAQIDEEDAARRQAETEANTQ